MITPNKTTPFKESITSKMLYILDEEFDEIYISDLYRKLKSAFHEMDEFIYSIDTLYILEKIEIDFNLGKIKKC